MKNLDTSLSSQAHLDESISSISGLNGLIKERKFTHKYIDGTVQEGKLIDSDGKIVFDSDGKIVLKSEYAEGSVRSTPIMDYYPKDKGFVENDGQGNYYYFEPLPEYKMIEIRRIEKLRDDALRQDKINSAIQLAKQNAAAQLEKQKIEAQAKLQADISQEYNAQKQIEDSEKSKKTKIIIGSLSVLVVAFVGLKYLKVI